MGIDLQRVRYQPEAKEKALRLIIVRRDHVYLGERAIKGSRFYDNETVLARLESAFTETMFLEHPNRAVDAALRDAAGSDYWYKYEKDWGFDHEDVSYYQDEE